EELCVVQAATEGAVAVASAAASPTGSIGEQLLAEGAELGDPGLDLSDLRVDQPVELGHDLAPAAPFGCGGETADLLQREPERFRLADEAELALVLSAVEPVAGRGALARRHQPDAVVVAHRTAR